MSEWILVVACLFLLGLILGAHADGGAGAPSPASGAGGGAADAQGRSIGRAGDPGRS